MRLLDAEDLDRTRQVIDGDGHLVENFEAIAELMPAEYGAGTAVLRSMFPPTDHLHAAQPLELLEGSFADGGPDSWLAFAEAAGIARAVLYPGYGLYSGYITNADWAIAACRAFNDWVSTTYLARGDLFVGMAILPLREPDAAADELRRAVTDLGMAGAVLPGNGTALPLGAKFYAPLYEEADRLGCAITVHGGAYNRMGMDHLNVYAAVSALGHPVTQLIAFADMVFNGVFDKYPNVRFGFLEAGVAWILTAIERFGRSYDTHIPLDPRGELLQLEPGETITGYLRRAAADHRFFVGCEGDEPFIPDVVRALGANVLMLSSDFPHETNEKRFLEEVEELRESPDLTSDDKDDILWANAALLYGLSQG